MNNFIKTTYNQGKKQDCFCQRFVIPFDNQYKSFWDFLILLLIAYNCITVSYYVAFTTIDALDDLDTIGEVMFGIDMFLRFFHAYKDPDSFEIIDDFNKISGKYIKGWFWVDLAAIFPFSYFFGGVSQKDLKLIRIFRLPKFLRLLEMQKMDQLLDSLLLKFSQKQKMDYLFLARYLYKFMRFTLFSLTLIYFIGCLWYFVVTNQATKKDQITFYDAYNMQNYDNFRNLIICCYFSMTTLTTVGYGDFVPKTELEKIICIIIMIVGIAFFSFIMGNFTDVLNSYEKKMGEGSKQQDLQQWITSLTKFTHKPLPVKLVSKIDDHFNFFWQHDKLCGLKIDDQYLCNMPKQVSQEMIRFMFDDIFGLFRGFFHQKEFPESQFYYEIAFEFQPRKYEYGELIIDQGEEVQEVNLCVDGEYQVSYKYEDFDVERSFGRGHYFGDYNIFSSNVSQYKYTAISSMKVFALPKHQLLKILSNYPLIKTRMISYSYQVNKLTNKTMALCLQQKLVDVYKKNFTSKEAYSLFRQAFQKKKQENQCKQPFKNVYLGPTQDLTKIYQNLQNLELRIDKINTKINLVDQNVSKQVEEIGDVVKNLKLIFLNSNN